MKNITKISLLLAIISLFGIGANLPRQTDRVTFAVIGDYGTASQAAADVASLVKSWNPDFIVTVGDNNYPDGASYSIDKNIGQFYSSYIFKYQGKYGAGSETRRFFPALGNHDWHDGSANPYLNYFNLPGNERFYDFVYGPVHFFVLNSVKHEEEGNTDTSGQGKWLKSVMSASTAPFQVVVTHYPPYSSGKHGSVPFMQWPFKEWGADAVLAGHNHIYERLSVNGLTYFVNGLGGDELGKFRSAILPESLVRYNANYGAMRVEATSAFLKFQFIARDNTVIDEYIISNSVPSVSSITSAAQTQTNANQLDFYVTFSEPVLGVDISDFALTGNAQIINISGEGANYVVSVNAGAGTLRLDLADNDSITNLYGVPLGNSGAGNGNASSQTYEIDHSAPMVLSITRVHANPTNLETVEFALAFSEPVSGVDISDFSLPASTGVGGAYIRSVEGIGAAYRISVNTGSADDILRLDLIHNNSITDMAGNLLTASFNSGEPYAVDRTAPYAISMTRAQPNPTSAESVAFYVTFSEPVQNVDTADFVLSASGISGAYISAVNGSGATYAVTIFSGQESGELRLDLENNFSITDAIGNPLLNSIRGEAYTLDKSAPSARAITRVNAETTNAETIGFNVTFSEPVTGVDATDFVLSASGISGAYISNVSGMDTSYLVSVVSGAGEGSLRLDLIDNDSITNSAGKPLGLAGANNGNFNAGETYQIDKTSPFIVSILRADANPTNAEFVNFTVYFSERVYGVDSADFSVNTSSGAYIANISGADSTYTVSIKNGNGLDALRLDALNNYSIFDAAGNLMNGTFTNGETYAVNRAIPIVTAITRTSPDTTSAASVDFVVYFSEPVSGVDATDFTLATAGIVGASITRVYGVGAIYVVSANTGINNGVMRVELTDDNSIINAFGNPLGGFALYDGNFTASEIYEVVKFTTVDSNFPAPTLNAPIRGALLNTSAPNLTWTKIADAQYYEIIIARDVSFTQIVAAQVVNKTSFISPPLGDGAYYWRARGYNSNGQPGKFSAAESFTLDATPPAAPILLAPANDARLSAKFNFTWTKITDATRYEIQIDNNADFSSPERISWQREPSYQVASMNRKITHYWRVRARDMAGNWSAWSNVFRLIVP